MGNSQIIIDNIELDLDNKKFFKAADIVLNTDVPVIYLTGKAGTGKSVFVKYIKEIYEKEFIVLAPTGVAAVNVKGQTIHSFFPLDFSVYSPDDDRLNDGKIQSNLRLKKNRIELIQNLDMIIIDEISMVRCDVLDCIDRILKYYRKNHKPFGGVKMLLVGDTFQLPPVVKSQEKEILYKFYKSEFFFDSRAYQTCSPFYIQLEKVYRQEEKLFLSILEKVRVGEVSGQELNILNENSSTVTNNNAIRLSSMVAPVENYNSKMLESINSDIVIYSAKIGGQFPRTLMPVDTTLELKIGAQVMIMKNKFDESGNAVHYNGQIGVVSEISGDNIIVKCNEDYIPIQKAIWENNRYIWDEESKSCKTETLGTFEQYPLKLAWAITIHKSQGLTFDNVSIDLSDWVANGGAYVALSRCRKLSGIHFVRPLSLLDIKIDKNVLKFAHTETPDTMLVSKIEDGKISKLYYESQQKFEINDAAGMLMAYKEASKMRDITDTILFHKFIRVKLSLFHRYKQLFSNAIIQNTKLQEELDVVKRNNAILSEENKDVKTQLKEVSDNLILSNKNNSKLLLNQDKLNADIDNKNNSLNDIQSKLEITNKELNVQLLSIIDLKDKIAELEREKHKLDSANTILQNDCLSLNADLISTKDELCRVNNISWWQKLLGKK